MTLKSDSRINSKENRIARLALYLPKLKPRRARQVEIILSHVYRNLYSKQIGAGRDSEEFDEAELEAEVEAERQADERLLTKLEADIKAEEEAERISKLEDEVLAELFPESAPKPAPKRESASKLEDEILAELLPEPELEPEPEPKSKLEQKPKPEPVYSKIPNYTLDELVAEIDRREFSENQQPTIESFFKSIFNPEPKLPLLDTCGICKKYCTPIKLPTNFEALDNQSIVALIKKIEKTHKVCGLCSKCLETCRGNECPDKGTINRIIRANVIATSQLHSHSKRKR